MPSRLIFLTVLAVILLLTNAEAQPSPPDQSASGAHEPKRLPAKASAGTCRPQAINYPESSVRNGEEGTARVRYFVDETGKLINTQIITSTGHTALDEATVRMHTHCERFKPATDTEGKSVKGSFDIVFKWRIN